MKNRLKIILGICFIFLAHLSLVLANNAHNIKVYQDKYRCSYNEFMKALKEGGDQERINRLSSQCKSDFAEYKTALEENKDFSDQSVMPTNVKRTLNSPQEVKKVNKVQQRQGSKIKKPESTFSEFSKVIKIYVNGVEKQIKFPYYSFNHKKSVSQPIKIVGIKKELRKPLRIKDDSSIPITALPDFIKTGYNNDVINIFNNLVDTLNNSADNDSSIQDKILPNILYICSKYASNPELCALAKLYYAEMLMKISKDDTAIDMNYKIRNICKQILVYYSHYELTNNNYSTVKSLVNDQIKYIENVINIKVDKKKTDINYNDLVQYIISSKESFNKHESDINSIIFADELYIPDINGDHDSIVNDYNIAITNCISVGLYDEAEKLMSEFESFYTKNYNYDVKYLKDGIETSKTINVKKDVYLYMDNYFQITRGMANYYQNNMMQSQTVTYEEIARRVDTFNDIAAQIPRDGERLNSSNYGNYITAKSLIQKYKKHPKISSIYFSKNENLKISNEDVLQSSDWLLVRCKAADMNVSYPFKLGIRSSVSKKERIVTVVPDCFYTGEYYQKFQPNDSDEILIVDHEEAKNSISVLNGFAEQPDGKMLYNCGYFEKKLLYADNSTTEIMIDDGIIPCSSNFCQAGGGEFIYPDKKALINDLSTETSVVVIKNTAKWFVIEGHGDIVDGSIQYKLSSGASGVIKPQEASEHYGDDVDVLILNACYCLHYGSDEDGVIGFRAKLWHRFFKKQLILGYHSQPNPLMPQFPFKYFSDDLLRYKQMGKILSKSDIAKLWLEAHVKFLVQGSLLYRSDMAKYARYVLNDNNGQMYKYGFVNYGSPKNTLKKPRTFIDYIELEEVNN